MQAIRSKINMRIRSVNVINNGIEKFLLRLMLWSFAVLAFWYVFLLGSMVFNIVERRALEKDILVLSNEVRDLELTYLSMSNDIDLALAHSLGFREIDVKFATRKSLGRLSGSAEEPLGSIKVAKNEI